MERDARLRIRRALAEAGRRIEVLDDDPAGSQTVHGVDVVTVFEPDELAAGLSEAGSTCFILTNTRSLPEADAVELNIRVGRMLFELADRLQAPEVMVGRRSQPAGFWAAAQVLEQVLWVHVRPTRPPSPWRCSGRDRQAHGPG